MDSFLAAVVQNSVQWLRADEPITEVRQRHGEEMAAIIDATCASTSPSPRLFVFAVQPLNGTLIATNTMPGGGVPDVALDIAAAVLPGGPLFPVVEACKRHNCFVSGSSVESQPQFPGLFFHSGFIIGGEGLLLRAPKVQGTTVPEVTLVRDVVEKYIESFGADSVLPVVETAIGGLACCVHSEVELPELTRELRRKGARVITNPTNYTHPKHPNIELPRAAAYFNSCYVLSAIRSRNVMVGKEDWVGGTSTIYGPSGELLASISGEGVAIARIDPDYADEIRKEFQIRRLPAPSVFG